MSRPVSEAKHNLSEKKKFEEWVREKYENDWATYDISVLEMIEIAEEIRTYVLTEALSAKPKPYKVTGSEQAILYAEGVNIGHDEYEENISNLI